MSRYEPYPAYKDSGVEWLGEVPAHWEVTPLKRLLSRNDSGVWGEEPESEQDPIVLRSTEQGVDGEWQITSPARRKLSGTDIDKTLLYEGDLLVTKSSGSEAHIGKTSLVTPDVAALRPCYSNFMQRLRVTDGHPPRFLHFILNNRIAREQMAFLSSSTTGLANLNATVIGQVQVAEPSLSETTTIARFLDRETTRIDTLIEKKTRFIELLKEKRAAVITHAVTKGLDPDVPMKDSGVEWLGEIPEHWIAKPIKYIGRLKGGAGFPHEEQGVEGEEIDFHKVNALAKASAEGILMKSQNTISIATANRLGAFVFPARSIVFAKVGAALLLGRIRATASSSCIDNNMMGLVVFEKHHDTKFVRYTMELIQFDLLVNPGAVPSVNERQIANFPLPCPNIEEQVSIVIFLDRETSNIDTLISLTERSIHLLKEKRSALITAAVTGKIDVREAA